ncbi:MAG: tetratricopeptide repeat protein [Acidobacteriia bacterium]|nr:tetratricopeptide repeat protein [Terriglobia bacterium]
MALRLPRLRVFLLLSILFLPAGMAAVVDVPAFLNVIPGTTTKAEVDLSFGESLRRVKPDAELYEYAPPAEANIFDHLVITFFADTKQVARLDAYFKSPHSADSIRTDMQLGKRVLSRDRSEGGVEEFYYPKFNGLLFNSKAPDAPTVAVSYFSPRYLADIYVSRCSELLRTKRYSEASDEADKAVVVDPDYARGYLAQGWSYQSQKNYDEAIVRFLAASNAKYAPHGKGEAHTWLGLMYWNHKNLADKAQEEFQKGVSTAPDDYYTHYQYGRFLRAQKQMDRALVELARAVELSPRYADARLDLAAAYYEKKDYAKAAPHYEWLSQWAESEATVDRDDNFKSLIHFNFAYTLAETGKQDRAIEIYQLALKKNPKFVNALNNLGAQYQALKNYPKAEEYYRAGLRLEPKNFLLNRNLARVLLDRGQFEEARQQAESALSLKPDDVWTMIDVAHAWASLGKKRQALSWIEKAVAAGFRDKNELTNDRYFEGIRNQGDFKKLVAQLP